MATCDPQLFNEILTILLNELQRKPTSTTSGKKIPSAEANTISKSCRSESFRFNARFDCLSLVCLVKTHVQALTSICRLASQRLSEHMQDIVRITLSFIENTPSHSSSDDHQHDDELVEFCLQAIETYLKRCPKETNQFVPKIVDICIVYLKYDPNFNYEGKRRAAERSRSAYVRMLPFR